MTEPRLIDFLDRATRANVAALGEWESAGSSFEAAAGVAELPELRATVAHLLGAVEQLTIASGMIVRELRRERAT